ncbi:MAG: hypothetical protein AMXMBFR33_05430 [Candidatus Xenobia bacterium]|jgi:hypothetical protein
MIVCLSCGHANETGTGFCVQCNARLPKIDATSVSSGTGHITGRYEQIRDAAEKARSGQWSASEFGEFIKNLFEFLEKHKEGIVSYVRETGYYDYGNEEVNLGMTGVEKFEEGLEALYHFSESGDAHLIDQGLSVIWEGNEMINEAMRENRAARRRLEEEWGYM